MLMGFIHVGRRKNNSSQVGKYHFTDVGKMVNEKDPIMPKEYKDTKTVTYNGRRYTDGMTHIAIGRSKLMKNKR